MEQALIEAVWRGVRVVALVPDEIDHNLVRQASRAGYGRLLHAGVEIYEYTSGLLHAKTMVIDGAWATIGSTNLDNRSFALNAELNLFMHDETVARRLMEIFGNVASCGYILISSQVLAGHPEGQARIIAGLMTGIGFIGGGSILKGDNVARGTATAASLWNTAAIGAAVAFGRYEIALVLAAINFAALRWLVPFKKSS